MEEEKNVIEDTENDLEKKTKKPKKGTKKVEKKLSKTQKLEIELEALEDKNLRLRAEYDNYRKRAVREKSEAYTNSKAAAVEKLLPILDNFERAFENETTEHEDYKKGIRMIFEQFENTLSELGVETFGDVGDEFDPTMHDAVMHVEDDKLGENVVGEVFTRGYKIGDKVIRCASVKVAN